MAPEPHEMPTDTLDATLGFQDYEWDGEETCRARLPVTGRIRQPYGIVHGGAYAALAESMCSRATYEAVEPEGIALGQHNESTFLKPIDSGFVNAVGRARHRGRTSWVWDVEMTDDEGRLCAISRLIIAVRPRPG
jgi:1,4-dihydroxy-2-naphthoyl-CoA hydrolase